MDQVKIGAFLKHLRLEKGLTQQQLAEVIGTTNRSVSRWENGNTLPDITVLMELAEFYEVTTEELLDAKRKSEGSAQQSLKETLTKVADYSEKTNKKHARRWIIAFSAAFLFIICVLCTILITSVSKEQEIDQYPIYQTVTLDEEKTYNLLRDYTISQMKEIENNSVVNVADIKIYSTEEKPNGNCYAYCWVYEGSYEYKSAKLSEESAGSYPCRFELQPTEKFFSVVNRELPRDGELYSEDLKILFPEYVRNRLDTVQTDGTVAECQQQSLLQAKDYFRIK